MNHETIRRTTIVQAACLALVIPACGDDETGTLNVAVEAEDTIQNGIDPGDDSENIQDGWAVRFDKYVVAIGDINLKLSIDPTITAEAGEVFAIDLAAIPAAGAALWKITELEAERWEFNYATPGASEVTARHESVSAADFNVMADEDATYLVEGALTKADGASCPPASFAEPPADIEPVGANDAGDDCYDNPSIAFTFAISAPTRFTACALDGVSGVSIPAGGTQTATATIHGDHLFFNGFPEGDESGISRLAQWLADSDLNLDGEVTQAELEQLTPSDMPEMDERFQFGGSPIADIESQSLWVYVEAQLMTQGHMNGEGECQIDGDVHEQ